MAMLLLAGCKNSDSWTARQWHNTTAHYNMYFNAEQKWQETVLALKEGNKDDFRRFLELYNYGSKESLKANQGIMDEIVKKASTLIDRHPKSRWVDDAYMLTGRSYFMKGDVIAASDIFEYVNSNFKNPEIRYLSQLWIFRCLLAQGKAGEAESLITGLKNDKKFPGKGPLYFELQKGLAAVYLAQNKVSQSEKPLLEALKKAKGKMERYRLHFVLGQVYQSLGKYDEAVHHFAKVVKMNPPYEIAFNARINQVELLSEQAKDHDKANSILKRMLKDDKNIDFQGQIYYRMGKNELRARNYPGAVEYLNKSIRLSQSDRNQLATSYLAVGDMYFEKRNFEKAGYYYDSANRNLDEKHPEFKSLAKRGEVLGELIKHLIEIKQQDSLLRLGLDPVLREKTIDRIIELEKKQAASPAPPTDPGPAIAPDPGLPGTMPGSTSFPFYNQALRSKGLLEFQAIYGNSRTNRDYWRINAKKSTAGTTSGTGTAGTDTDTAGNGNSGIPDNVSPDRRKYYAEIPLTTEAQESARKRIEDALFAAAGVYQNSLNEAKDAIRYYTELLTRFPETRYEAQTLYELAKLFKAAGNTEAYTQRKDILKNKFPESIYNKLLENPDSATRIVAEPSAASKEIEDQYTRMYNFFKTEKWDSAMAVKEETDRKFAGNTIQARFDYLYAICMLRSGKEEKGIALLTQISEDFPGTAIAGQAAANVEAWKKLKSGVKPDTSTTPGSGSWTVWNKTEELYFLLSFPRGANTNMLRSALSDFNREHFIYETLDVSAVSISGETVYLTIQNFSKPEKAQEYLEFIRSKPDFFASKGLFEFETAWISKSNYVLLIKSNRVNNYMEYFRDMEK
ncbi:MAG: tetratricopeptide repeat protein [Bacteroidetes bacterium]|nr:tetratricopeptide repeat protein [Bacteroidota bacterium]